MRFTKENLNEFEDKLKSNGYKSIRGHLKTEDYGWWKTFGGDNGYQIAFLIYDFSKYPDYPSDLSIGIQNEFILNKNQLVDRVDMTISDDKMTFSEFEDFSYEFYRLINKFFIK